MNMVFWLLVMMAIVIVWFALRKVFIHIGRYINKVLTDTKEILESEDKNNEETGEMKDE